MMECKFCTKIISNFEESVTITKKGEKGISKVSQNIGAGDNLLVQEGDKVHKICRQKYLKRKSSESTDDRSTISSRSQNTFDFHANCFVCGNLITEREKNKKGCIRKITYRYKEVEKTVKDRIAARGNDPWAVAVNGRIQYALGDLHAENAAYHAQCYKNFCNGQDIPRKYMPVEPSSCKRGRPVDTRTEELYSKAVNFLLEKSREDEMVTVSDLQNIMENSLTTRWIQSRLQADFPDLMIANILGRENVITFRTTARKLLSDFSLKNKTDTGSEKISLIQTAARMIKEEIKAKEFDSTMYPTFCKEELSTSYLTPLLDLFLKELITSNGNLTKRAAIGQSIMQCCRPRSLLCPIQVGLGVQMHSMFGSRMLIDLLHKLGYSVSYTEILQFQASAAFHQNISLPPIPEDSVLHFAADNVDVDIRTLDGHNTFHGMGIIGIITKGCFSQLKLPRRKVTSDEVLSVGTIDFKMFKMNATKNLSLIFEILTDISIVDNTKSLGTLWQSTWIFKPSVPQWSGYMQTVLNGSHPGKSTVHIMPMIDEKSSDYSCIYTTMMFIDEQARRHGKTPLLTFDQPLYWKAFEILAQLMRNGTQCDIVLILGSFHTLMSFLGSIGNLMIGTGLQPLFEQVYAENSVPHILSGKAVARARRAHLLATCALEGLKMSEMYNIDLSSIDEELSLNNQFLKEKDLNDLGHLLDRSLHCEVDDSELNRDESFRRLLINQETFRSAHEKFRTSKLWLMYMDMVDTMCTFIKAERTGNFLLHQQSMQNMLPYFAASGHFLYTKSAYCYLQQMQALQHKNPEVYRCFVNGYNVVRRSDKFFAGIGTDLMIEQVLMRSVKATGGLTHGRGMNELQRTKWLLSTTTTAAVKQAMEEFAEVRYESSVQYEDHHKEISNTRTSRDHIDALKMLNYLELRNPFESHENIVSIETGEEGDESVNVDMAKDIGKKVIDSMVGKPILNISFSRKSMAKTMKQRTSIDVEGEVAQVDPQLLFQRLLLTVGKDENQLKTALTHELCSHPGSIVGNNGLMLEADKSNLSDEIWKMVDQDIELPTKESNPTFVIDGGHLLFKVKWKKGSTFQEIFK